MHNAKATPEGKAYAACGLWEQQKRAAIHIDKQSYDLPVTVLQGDVLRKEKLGELITRIREYGCQ